MFNSKRFFVSMFALIFVTSCTLSFNVFASDPADDNNLISVFIPVTVSRRESTVDKKYDSIEIGEPKDSSFIIRTSDDSSTFIRKKTKSQRRQEKQSKSIISKASRLHGYYFLEKQGMLYGADSETFDTSISNIIVDDVSDVKERFNDYIIGTERGNTKLRTLEAAGLDADKLDGIIKKACETGDYTVKENKKTEYGTSYRMDINLSEEHILRCGVFCDDKFDDEVGLSVPHLVNEARDTSLFDNSYIESPIIDDVFTCRSGCSTEDPFDLSKFLNNQEDYSSTGVSAKDSLMRRSPLSMSETLRISPRLITTVVINKPSKYKVNNVVRLTNPIAYSDVKVLKKGTFGLISAVNRNKYKVIFVTPRGKIYICNDVNVLDLEFIDNRLRI